LTCPCLPDPLPARPGANDQDQRTRRHQHVGTGEAPARQNPASLDVGDLRRSHIHPQAEDYWDHVNPIGPRSCYDEGKRCAETLFFDYRRQHNLPIKVARIFNTYGPRMHPNDGRVVSNFIVQALLGRDITVYGEGRQTRSFCYVDDLIDGLMRLMDTPANVTGPVNIGNPSEFTILELAQMVVALVGSRSKIVHRALPENDPKQRQPDISLAQELLSWRPRIALMARRSLGSRMRDFCRRTLANTA